MENTERKIFSKNQITNLKSQTNPNEQNSKYKDKLKKFRFLDLIIVWNLVFGAWDLS